MCVFLFFVWRRQNKINLENLYNPHDNFRIMGEFQIYKFGMHHEFASDAMVRSC